MGIYLDTSVAANFELMDDLKQEGGSLFSFKVLGGGLNLNFFPGPSYQEVVKQYHRLIG
jgi:alpha-glucosidase (family GH31 glycosyl hydrolase)